MGLAGLVGSAMLSRRPSISVFWCLLATGATEEAWKDKTNENGKVVQELKIEAPAMTEEDQYGYVMPDRYRCDACKAVMYHLDAELRKVQPKGRRMKQWEYTDVMDETCRSAFQGYGVKLINGENALSGPFRAAEESNIAPGSGSIQMSSDSWTKRLGEVCRKIVYEEVGEEDLYDKFYGKLKADDSTVGGLDAAYCAKELRYCNSGKKAKSSKGKENSKSKPPKETKASAAASSSSSSSRAKSDGASRVGAEEMLRNLAVKHGYSSDEYVGARTERDWEKLLLSIGGRIFNRQSDANAATCAAPASARSR
eukprot:TRINITY_DN46960_c0_g1_i1.p1 TRINITY_DN46960_c0_g1~~TRINITY_DN46960_c0_g1_i1.p1  ORF type:complete len:311 (-),score=72.89 TRINITY_DN46960_c0_g1_i1:99-1031(-)